MNLFSSSSFLNAVNNLSRLGTLLAASNERLASSKRVNHASDDPAGIIALGSLNSEIARLDAATTNGERIGSMIDTADGAMAQISNLLDSIKTNTLAAAGSGVTSDERAAYQSQIDSAIATIDRLASTTQFKGNRLLQGGLGYDTSGISAVRLQDVRVNSADVSGGAVTMAVSVASAAQKGVVTYTNGNLTTNVTFTVTGKNGAQDFSFATGTSTAAIATAVNAAADATGVTSRINGGTLYFETAQYGSDQNVNINVTSGTFALAGGVSSDSGADASVTINGQATTSSGLNINYSNLNTAVKFTMTESFNNGTLGATSFTITSGGAQWQLDPYPANRIHFGMSSLDSSKLGNSAVGYLNTLKSGGANALTSGRYQTAANIATAASSLVATERGRMGAVKTYAVDTSMAAMAQTKTALSNAAADIEDLDYAQEMASNNRLQILMQAATGVMGIIQQNATNLMSLLRF